MNNLDDKPVSLEIFYPKPDMVCTEPFSLFLKDYRSNLDFFFFVVRLVADSDKNRVIASKALLPGAKSQAERERLEKSAANQDFMLGQLKEHSSLQSRNITNGIVNDFLRYFSSIIQAASLKRPEILSSSQSIKIEDIFRFTRHRDLVAFIINRKINDLSYGGLSEMERYFSDRLGVQMFEDDNERKLLRFFIEIRNINVHNGSIANEIFASRVGIVEGFPYSRGKKLHIDLDQLIRLSENAMKVALHIDRAIGSKFRLKLQRYIRWHKPVRS
jgi:hypothetical protein